MDVKAHRMEHRRVGCGRCVGSACQAFHRDFLGEDGMGHYASGALGRIHQSQLDGCLHGAFRTQIEDGSPHAESIHQIRNESVLDDEGVGLLEFQSRRVAIQSYM